MKKIYALVAVMLVASFSFAQQIAPKHIRQFDGKKIIAPDFKHQKNVKGDEFYILYPEYVGAYWGSTYEVTGPESVVLQNDTFGLYGPATVADRWHANIHSVCQTFDFLGFTDDYGVNHNYYEDVYEEGDPSLRWTESLNLDSIRIHGGYFRGAEVSPLMKDTIIIGVLTTLTENDLITITSDNIPVFSFYEIKYDKNTDVQTGAIIYKFPIGAEDVSPEMDSTYYSANLCFPIGLNNIPGKVWNIAYTFKRGYDIDVDQYIPDSPTDSYFAAWFLTDTRPGYSPFDEDGNIVPFDDHFVNMNQGGLGDDDAKFDGWPSSHPFHGIYLPSYFYDGIHYPFIELTISSDNWSHVSVEDMEKENLTVYPNPAHNYFKVELAGDSKATVQLFNLVGQQVYSETASNLVTVNTSNLKAGIYMLKVSQNGKVYTSKVVVK